MTPGNYCTHALEHLTRYRDIFRKRAGLYWQDAIYVEMLMEDLAASEKFLLPNAGRLLHHTANIDSLLDNLRLPFRRVALEYTCRMEDNYKIFPNQLVSSRRIVYCVENDAQQGYWVTTVDWIDSMQLWQPAPIMVWIDYDSKTIKEQAWNHDGKSWSGHFRFKIVMPGCVSEAGEQFKGFSEHDRIEYMMQETLWDWQAVVQLTNFLACSNTHMERLAPSSKLNAKRLKSGKLPLYEYRILKIDAERHHNAPQRTGSTGAHASPRQHVRRGHIRHYGPYEKRADPTKRGGYTKWIQQMVVGDAENGVIEKDYSIV